jgi:transposase
MTFHSSSVTKGFAMLYLRQPCHEVLKGALNPHVNAKVRLRASIVRLNNAGWSAARLAAHFRRSPQSIHNDLDRFEQQGVAGLGDGKAPGAKPKFTAEMEAFIHCKIAEDRVWNSELLGEAIAEKFGVSVKREAVRVKLLELGYTWQRTRYAPGEQVDPEVVAEHRTSLETLKRGH